jgi:hypothetical protein
MIATTGIYRFDLTKAPEAKLRPALQTQKSGPLLALPIEELYQQALTRILAELAQLL